MKVVTEQTKGYLFAFTGALLFSSKAVLIKLAYGFDIAPISLLALRLSIAAPVYIIILWRENLRTPMPTLKLNLVLRLILAGILGYYLASFLDFTGLQYLSSGLERMILFLYPSFVILLSAIFKRTKVAPVLIFALAMSYIGIVLSYMGDTDFDPATGPRGALLILASAFSFAIFMILSGDLQKTMGTNRYTAIAFLIAAALTNLHVLISGAGYGSFEPGLILLVIVLSIFGTLLPSLLMMHGVRILGAGPSSVIGSVGPVMTLVLGAILLGETVGALEAVGVAAVVFGGLMAKRGAAMVPKKSVP